MKKFLITMLKASTLFLLALIGLITFYVNFFDNIHALSYRLVAIFLSIILISNLGAKLLAGYFKHH